MENHTKRIRKARRQGLTKKKEMGAPSRIKVASPADASRDTAGAPRAKARRKSLMTQRKTERAARNTTRRAAGRRTVASRG